MPNGTPPEEPDSPAHVPFDPQTAGEAAPPRLDDAPLPVMRLRSSALAPSSRWDALAPLLNNRLILSGLGLVVVLLLIAIVLVSIGRGSEDTHRAVLTSLTPQPTDSTAQPRGSLTGRVVTTTSLRNGPDSTYAILGTLPKGASVAVIGRNDDESWFQIRYPPGSNLRGWVNSEFLEITGDVSQLVVAGPGPSPSVSVPAGPSPTTVAIPTEEEATSTPTVATPSITATPTLGAKPTPTEEPEATPTSPATPKPAPGG